MSFGPSTGWTFSRSQVTLAGNTNNLSLPDTMQIHVQGGGFQITGFAGGAANRVLVITEISLAGSTLIHNSGSSTAGNRLILSLAGNVSIPRWHTVVLIYNVTDTFWYQLGQVTQLV